MIKILHLYYDLLNQYGEQGNILALKDSFRNQNVEVSIDLLSCGDKIDFKKYDLIYMGTGSDENLYIALEDIKKYKKELSSFTEVLKQYDLLLERTDDENAIEAINANILSEYEEAYGEN